ncbi:secreted antigen 1 [Babesia divergens]|uniref:Secreted antigen 1 n=1 Tax=Babesia divergens TaxID=32595 RepID=A0AAD9LJH1_BABDI|nr:secreted antigen 1 [Babesia divergens]
MSEAKVPCDFEFKHDTLKSILEELGKLHNTTTSTRHKVFQQLRDGLNTYCGTAYLDAFYGYRDYGSGRGYSGTILLLTKAGQNVSEEILQRPSWDEHLDNTHKDHEDCGEKYFNAFKACLPKLFSALLFLFFNVAKECNQIGGGSWNTLKVKGSGTSLYNWLTESDSDSDLIPRKFSQEDLNTSNKGQNVAEQLKKAVSLTPNKYEGSLQNVLCGFMFVCSWDDPLTGHACLFLYKFCDEVAKDSVNAFRVAFEEKYSGKKYDSFKELCRTLKSQLDSLVNGTSKLYAVCHGNTNLFKDLWDNEKILQYCTWLKRNIYSVIASLASMSQDCPDWNSSSIQSGGNAGPFKYGFVFKDNKWQDDMTKGKLQEPISKLTASLKKLLADLLFVFPWDDALTGHACLFLLKFCEEVGKDARGNLQGRLSEVQPTISFENLKRVCGQLKGKLQPFVNGTSGLSAVCHQNQKLFESLWNEDKFGEYVKWLKTRLDSIIKSLQTMSKDSSQWTDSKLKNASSAGPSRFGFVFKDDSWGDQTFKSGLSTYTSPLTASDDHSGSLNELEKALEPSSAGATAAGAAGGILGLGGAGAGAAYATNAFGFQNFISGLISGLLK